MKRVCSFVFRTGFVAILLAALIGLAARQAEACVWYVKQGPRSGGGTAWSDPVPTIGEAVAAAQEGDTIWVTEGEYLIEEPIRITKRLNIYGGFLGVEQHPDERVGNLRTIIDGGDSTACMAVSADTLLDGIDFFECNSSVNYGTGGKDLNKYLPGPAITAENAKLVMRNCALHKNTGPAHGAMRVVNCQVDICDIRIENSIAVDISGAVSGGMYLENCTGRIRQALIRHAGSMYAGGMYVNKGSILVDRCQFILNSAGRGPGGGLRMEGEHTVQDSLIYGNYALFAGGAYLKGVTVKRCMFIGNGVNNTVDSALYASNAKLYNCIIHNNKTDSENIVGLYNSTLVNSTIVEKPSSNRMILSAGGSRIVNSIIINTGTGSVFRSNPDVITYSLVSGGFAGEGNIDADPLFVAPESFNFKLQAASPAVNAGTENIPDLPDRDYAGKPRNMGSAPDMGAYELPQLPMDVLSRLLLPNQLDSEWNAGGEGS